MLEDTVRQTIRRHDLIREGDHVVLGLSGGPDSVCLFHVLQRLAHPLHLTIHPIHVNHRLRPGAADRDQAYVEQLCARAQERAAGEKTGIGEGDAPEAEALTRDADGTMEASAASVDPISDAVSDCSGGTVRPCRSFVVDVGSMAQALGLTSEEAGRKVRYDAFVQVAREVVEEVGGPSAKAARPAPGGEAGPCAPAPRVVIAVAQNANDQAETILQRLLRGTGPDGLSGIAYERSERGIPVVRPLLDVPREEIEEYCRAHCLQPVTDQTNAEPIYTRNKIRLQLLPLLREYNPNIVQTLGRLARIAAADRAYLRQEAEAALEQLRTDEAGIGVACVERTRHDADGQVQRQGSVESASQPPGRGTTQASLILDRAGLAALPDAIRRRVLVMAFEEIGLIQDITEERLRAADAIIGIKQAPKTVEFPHGYRLTVARGQVIFAAKA